MFSMGEAVDVLLLIVLHVLGLFGHGKGIPIDPQHPDNILTTHTHCLEDNKPILIKDPFDPAVAQDENFLLMSWDRYRILPSGEEQEQGPLYEFTRGSPAITSEKYVAYENWGLQVNDVTLEDSARYKATVILTTGREERIINIVVAKPPTLQSEKLDVTRVVNTDNHTVTLSCGRIADLGHPPVSTRWKTETGIFLPADYRNGYLELTLPTQQEIGKVICVIDEAAPAAKCIPEVDKPRWKFPVTESFAGSSGGEDSSAPGAVVGLGIGVGVVTVVAAVVIGIYWYRRRLSAQTVRRETPPHYERTQQTTEQHDHKALFTSADDYSLPTDTDSSAVTPNSPPMTTWQSATEYVDVDDYYYERVKQVTQHQQRQGTDPKSGFSKRNNYINV